VVISLLSTSGMIIKSGWEGIEPINRASLSFLSSREQINIASL